MLYSKKYFYSIRASVLITLLTCIQPGYAGSEITNTQKTKGIFQTLTTDLSKANQLALYDFATIALKEVIVVYENSYQESHREQPQKKEAQLKLARWKRGLRIFIDQLITLQNTLNYDNKFDLITNPSGPAVLYINDNPVVLSGPEIAKANLMEQNIVERFCLLHDCSVYREKPAEEPIVVEKFSTGTWHLMHRQGARYETPDGLIFIFRTLDQREAKQQFCETLVQDLRLFLHHIKRAKHAGYLIDWQSISVSILHDDKTGHVVINDAGDYLSMEFNSINKLTKLDQRFIKWAEKHVADKNPLVTIKNADMLWAQSKY
jgi:hypothetical protein